LVEYNFDLLSPNLLSILETASKSDNLCKYLYYNEKQPTVEPSLVDPSVLLFNQMYPMPFDPDIVTEDCSQLRVFYLDGNLQDNMTVTQLSVIFDIIVAKSLWLINEADGSSSIRPYSIMNEVLKQFRNKSIGTVGRLLFKSFRHLVVNKQFDGVRIVANMTGFSGGGN
jgi:hypothetical protein